MSRGVHDFDSHNSIIFPHVENDVFGDPFIDDSLRFVVKPDVEEIRFVVVDDIILFRQPNQDCFVQPQTKQDKGGG